MKLMDKLKNALFEEEYVEVEEKPRPKAKPKKEKVKVKPEKPIAKKISIAEKVEEDDKEEKDEVFEERELLKSEAEFRFPVMAEEDFSVTQPIDVSEVEKEKELPPKEEERPLYQASKREEEPSYDDYIREPRGAYEKKPERTGFKPSPIISPIYGVLDKNYKKEEVREKKEVRLSSFSREDLDLDAVRKKAYGDLSDDLINPPKEENIEEILEEEDNLLVNLNDEDTPSVNKVTVGDAEEYFEDLGLEYNKDYIDASREKASGRRTQEKKEEVEEPIEKPTPSKEENDNLFDLIDSMYNEEEDKEE